MKNVKANTTTQGRGLTCNWVTVVGEDGRLRMEARWSDNSAAAASPHAA